MLKRLSGNAGTSQQHTSSQAGVGGGPSPGTVGATYSVLHVVDRGTVASDTACSLYGARHALPLALCSHEHFMASFNAPLQDPSLELVSFWLGPMIIRLVNCAFSSTGLRKC